MLPVSWTRVSSFIEPIRKQLDVISMIITTVANSVFLAGKLFPWVPQMVTRSAFVTINTVGFLFLDWQVSSTIKSIGDFCHATSIEAHKMVVLTALTVMSTVSGILLMVGGFGASVASWMQHPAVAASMYTVMRPWGVTFLFVAIFMDVANYFTCTQLLTDLRLDATGVVQSLQGKKPMTPLALRVRYVMDKDTLHKLLQGRCGWWSSRKLVNEVIKNVETQTHYTESNLGLRALGYVGLFICKANPDSLIQAITLFVTSVLYTGARVYKKCKEYAQQQRIGQLLV